MVTNDPPPQWAAKEALDALQSNKTTRLDELGEQIRTHHSHATRAAGEAVESARLAGECLIEAKSRVEHGRWLPWVKEHCQMSPRTAQAYMRIAGSLSEGWANTQRAAYLTSLRRAQAMLASPRSPDACTESVQVRVLESEPIPLVPPYLTRDEAEGASPVAGSDNDDGPEPVFVKPVSVFAEPAPQVAAIPKGIADLRQIDAILDEAELSLAEAIKAIDYPEIYAPHQPEKLRAEIEKIRDCVRRAKGLSELARLGDEPPRAPRRGLPDRWGRPR
jgi:hypothetical protein